jgi:HSP20 family protein
MLPVQFTCGTNGGLLGLNARRANRLFDLFDEPRRVLFPVDVREEADRYVIEANLPGVQNKDLDITFEDGRLTLTAEYNRGEEVKDAKIHIRERSVGKTSRSFDMPNDVDAEKIDANLANGVLTVTVAKLPEKQPRKITVHGA